MLMKILVVVVAILAVLSVIVALQPSEFRIARSTTISAPPAALFPRVNDLHAFQEWNPYAKKDPAMTQSWEGPAAGPGAVYRWSGNAEIGEGSMRILESRPNELVRIELAFLRPFETTNTVDFTFVPSGDQTTVTWSMSGTNGFMAKAAGLVMDMDAMVGGDFEKGLADMKALAEKSAG